MYIKHLNFILLVLTIFVKPYFSLGSGTDTVQIYFENNISDIGKFYTKLDSISKLKNISSITIIGFTDSVGSADNNLKLAQKRADNVKLYLSHKLPSVPISSISKGEKVSASNIKNDLWANRKVEIFIRYNNSKGTENTTTTTNTVHNPILNPFDEILTMEVGESKVMGTFNFVGGKAILTPGYESQIDSLAKVLKKNKNIRIEIQGHICCRPPDRIPRKEMDEETQLSINRAKYIYDQLVLRGIMRSRLSYKGFGSTKPKKWPEVTEEDEAANRRVEIMVIGK